MSKPEKSSCLLPSSVVPVNYDVQLRPDFQKFTFDGIVNIQIEIRETTREIVLHAADLNIMSSEVALCCDGSSSVTPVELHLDRELETATLVFADDLPVGNALLSIPYFGVLNDKMVGFYRSKYTTVDGHEKYLATTQFEATDARRALPCWDEPAFKATFDVRLLVPKNLVALSNMPVKSVEDFEDANSGLQIVSFHRTPVMSTYLLAFVVGEFEYIETKTNNGTLVRVYSMPGRSEQGRFALDVGKRSLEFYNEYFKIPYPLPKLDMIAIPDFAAGAMENWGLVTYRENALLFDEVNSSATAKQRVAEVVAHELAHQWFGNLVTMQWWNGLWLNEGFATWMANFVMANLFPEWDIWTQFVSDDCADALSLDGLRSTHPIEVPVDNPNDISQIFDAISYSKGASVIHMIHNFIGAEAFRAGLQVYLSKHAYGNAVTEDLWSALAETSGQPVHEMMDTWTKQPGYPLIQVVRHDENSCSLFQQRFLAGGDTLTEEESAQKWHIPLVTEFRRETGVSETTKEVLEGAGHFSTQGVNLVKLNAAQTALVRVNYLPEQWHALAEAVLAGKLTPVDRYGIISDALALARAGHLSTDQLISLVASYKNEDNYTVWMMVLEALGALNSILEETPENESFKLFASSALAPIVGKLGWTENADESHTTKLLRESVLHAAGSYGDQETVAEAKARFHAHAQKADLAHPNIRRAVYGLTAKHGGKDVFDIMVEMYRKETFQEEKVRLLVALGKFVDPNLLPAVLEYAFNSGEVRSGDVIYVLGALGSHGNGRRVAWKYLTENWESISTRYSTGGLKMLARTVSSVCSGFSRAEDADVIEQFFKEHPAPSATRAIAESLERIRVRSAWYERDKDVIAAALKAE